MPSPIFESNMAIIDKDKQEEMQRQIKNREKAKEDEKRENEILNKVQPEKRREEDILRDNERRKNELRIKRSHETLSALLKISPKNIQCVYDGKKHFLTQDDIATIKAYFLKKHNKRIIH